MTKPRTVATPSESPAHDRISIISIGMPVYNGAAHIRAALDSLLSQTFVDFIIIVSDNASIDGTGDIVQEYALRDSRIVYVRQPKNIGAEANFKFVFHASSSEYFMWAAADDIRSTDFLESNLRFLEARPEYLASTLRTRFEGGSFDPIRMGDASLDQDDCADRLIRFFGPWHANGRFYSLFRRAELASCVDAKWDFLGSDWSVMARLACLGKFNRIDAGWIELGRQGVSNTSDIFSAFRKDFVGWLLPFHRLTADTWRLMVAARAGQRLHIAWRLALINLHAFLVQHKVMLTRGTRRHSPRSASRRPNLDKEKS